VFVIPFQLHRRVPLIRRPFYQRDKVVAERDKLASEKAVLTAELERLTAACDDASLWDRVEWHNDHALTLSGVLFRLTTVDYDIRSASNDFALLKDRSCMDALRDLLAGARPRRILDVGIFQGGSAVFYDLLFDPAILVAVDINAEVPALTEYIAARNRSEHVVAYFGQDQADRCALSRIIVDHFPDGIDLVVDDASHRYDPSRSTFEAVFPSLRPGGWYVIEDWGWNHWQGIWQEKEIIPGAPLSKLVLELATAQPRCITAIDGLAMIDQVHIIGQIAAFRRGWGIWPSDKPFDLEALMLARLPVLLR
jgi:SAM-dependent methyltransferase